MHSPIPTFMAVLLVLPAFLLSACSEESARLENGATAPEFRLSGLSSEVAQFPADYRNQVVALRFWADWCPFCESEMKALDPLIGRYRDQGLRVLAINVRQDQATARAFIERIGVSGFDTLLDEDGSVARDYGVIGLPSTLFVDRQGRVAGRVLGESTPAVFERIIQDLL